MKHFVKVPMPKGGTMFYTVFQLFDAVKDARKFNSKVIRIRRYAQEAFEQSVGATRKGSLYESK